jgi:hypothetical protein
MFRAGISTQSTVSYYRKNHRLAFREVQKRLKMSPNALFHLEGELIASVLPWLPKTTTTIWSLHDLPSTVLAATTRIACESQGRKPSVSERREPRFATRFERRLATYPSLVLYCPGFSSPPCAQERNARDVIHYQYKSTTLRVDFDRAIRGNFLLPHEWSVKQVRNGQESENEVVTCHD